MLRPYRRRVKVIAATRIAPSPRRARAQAERVAPVVSTSSTRRTLRGTAPRDPLVRGRGPDAVEPGRAAARERLGGGEAARAAGAEPAAGTARAPAGGAERGKQAR